MMCAVCGDWVAEAWNSPTWKQAAQKYHQARAGHVLIVETAPEKLAQLRRLMGDDVSLNAAWAEFSDPRDRPIPKATIDAIMFDLRERGTKALEESATKRRLSELSEQQLIEVGNRLQQLRPEIARAWTATEVQVLFEARIKT
jgi:hypothetical protein